MEADKDDKYMYEFRTNICTTKKCRNSSKCFDAHSSLLRRRVPSLCEDGLFNYIPELCPQWGKSKRCNKGERCLRSHGWLEIIFHPLLFKTKICKSKRKNGVCREYGVYCAKAHNLSEVRNLVKIYGVNWKKHYDLSLRDKDAASPSFASKHKLFFTKSTRFSKKQSNEDSIRKRMIDRPKISTTQWSKQTKGEGNTKTSPEFSYRAVEKSTNSPLFTSSPLFGGYSSSSEVKTDRPLDEEITSYIQLYSD